MQSTLEFNLRLQEFVELARAAKYKEAILYARKHLASLAAKEPQHMPLVQRAMGSLVFTESPKPDPYQVRTVRQPLAS